VRTFLFCASAAHPRVLKAFFRFNPLRGPRYGGGGSSLYGGGYGSSMLGGGYGGGLCAPPPSPLPPFSLPIPCAFSVNSLCADTAPALLAACTAAA
jgi:hypothetical protein